ncbi:hypothetical protein [Antrihabitans cavernicola]|uniref:DUF2269 family protein n=1 Tax=Antrihabitans cavernicola TaxID=2495913 RepID=A0A5A7SCF9_9NOCA|nr:hypothetical protein [Spelaeibacter cavernicola]KAA0023254.1 hypothetical protein FOY51_07420 [Spelaeibacter cavernicola]
MSPSPMLLGIHVTLALGLTVLVGVQSVELGRIRRPDAAHDLRPLTRAIATVPFLVVLVGITGGMLIGDGSRGGPWIGAGVFSAVAIAATAGWTRRAIRRPTELSERARAGVSGVQWGIPAVTLAAAFLMADRPQNPIGAVVPVVLATLVAVVAAMSAQRGASANTADQH